MFTRRKSTASHLAAGVIAIACLLTQLAAPAGADEEGEVVQVTDVSDASFVSHRELVETVQTLQERMAGLEAYGGQQFPFLGRDGIAQIGSCVSGEDWRLLVISRTIVLVQDAVFSLPRPRRPLRPSSFAQTARLTWQ